MRRITSRQNTTVARYRAAARGDVTGLLLVDGLHLVREALAAGLRLRHVVVADDALGSEEIASVVAQLTVRRVDIAVASASVMSAVSPVRSTSPIAGLADRPESTGIFKEPHPLVIIACDVQDPGNLGAIVRVAEAAAASGLIAAGKSTDPFGWKALRGSMGSAFRLPIARAPRIEDALADAKRHGCRTFATTPRGGRSIFDVDLTGAVAVLIGGEGDGLSDARIASTDERLTIPMRSPVESLNAAVAAALVVYEARRQRQ